MGGEKPQANTADRSAPTNQANATDRAAPDRLRHSPNRHSYAPTVTPAPPPSFLRRQEPRPPLASRRTHHRANTHSLPQFIPPPFQGEVRWGVRSHKSTPPIAPPPIAYAPTVIPPPQPSTPTPQPSFLRRQEPHAPRLSLRAHHRANTHLFPNSSLPPSRGEVRWGVRGCERAPRSCLRRNDGSYDDSAPPPSLTPPAPP